jgi:nitrogen fixation/metabolism regulation signal transduction histidine kinase
MSLYDLPGIKIQLDLEKQPYFIKGDSTMLRQVLHNLLQNAQDALVAQKSPAISVKTSIINDSLLLTVKDNGAGFPSGMMPRAFEPYMTTKTHGTGLGLAIVKKIIEEHKGSIKIENVVVNESKKKMPADADTAELGAMVTIHFPLLVEKSETSIH